MNAGESVERRKSRRFNVELGALTLLRPDSDEACGDILNISRGGLALMGSGNREHADDHFIWHIIWSGNNDMVLRDVPASAVWHYDVTKKTLFRKEKKRVLGVRFGDLTARQKAQLEYCLEKHTIIEE